MAQFTDYTENKILNLMRNVAWTEFAAYVALFTTATGDDGAGTEVSGGAYARKLADFTAATGTGGTTSNASAITFTVATGDWGTITYVAIYDAVTAGNMIMHGALDASRVVSDGDTFKINAGDLDVTVA